MGARTRGSLGVRTAILTATMAHAQPARLVGAVIDSLRGGTLSGATVMVIDDTTRQAETDSAGRFRIDSVPPGTHRIAALHPLLDALDITVVSPPITFAAGRTVTARLATPSAGALLRMLCSDDSLQPTAVLGRVLGADNDQAVRDCVNLFVDGHRVVPQSTAAPGAAANPYSPLPIDEYVSRTELAAVEVYNTSAIPARFETAGESCQAVVVWTTGSIAAASAAP